MSERLYRVSGAELWLAEQGAGVPLLLCNGGPGCCDYLAPVSALIENRARVYRWEQRGCGRSSAGGPYDLATCLSDMEELRRALGVERWIVGGHSWGANLALAYALTYPDRTSGLIMLAGTGVQNDREWHDAYRAGRDAGHDPQPNYAYPPNADVNREVMLSWRAFIKRPPLLREIAALQTPTLAVHGSADIRPGWPTAQLAALLPNARLLVLAGAAHLLWESHADALRDALRNFIDGQAPRVT
jgi:proline iminopeptidase